MALNTALNTKVAEPRFDEWLDSFFVHFFSRRPVDATFAGKNEYNGTLPDVSAQGLNEAITEIRTLLAELKDIPRDSLDRFRKIDYDLAEGFLHTQLWERTSGYFFEINPTTYTGEAAFALVSLFISDFRPVNEKTGDLESRLAGIPAFLAAARDNLTGAPPAWTERAIEECTGALNFLTKGIPILAEDEGLDVDASLVSAAADAFRTFQTYLEHDLMKRPVETVSCGAETFRNIMRWSHQSDVDPLKYADHAEEVIRRCDEELAKGAAEFGADSPEEAIAALQDTHPDRETYLDTYKILWEQSRKLNERERLVTWTDFPLEYTPIPRWARDVQPYLYFLFYRCPPRYNRPDVYRYHVIPVEPDMTPEEQERRLRSNNTFVIKTNHVLHHGGIGHHVQNWNAVRATSRIAQVAATDGPARLSMLCAGTLCEGWACYATTLAGDHGFLTPLEKYAELAGHRRMAARAVVDVRLHCGIYPLEEAARFYQERAHMPKAAAMAEAVKNSLFPGGAIMYLYGVEGIERLREELTQKRGSAFSLQAFHDEFLSYGAVPVDRIAEEMKK